MKQLELGTVNAPSRSRNSVAKVRLTGQLEFELLMRLPGPEIPRQKRAWPDNFHRCNQWLHQSRLPLGQETINRELSRCCRHRKIPRPFLLYNTNSNRKYDTITFTGQESSISQNTSSWPFNTA